MSNRTKRAFDAHLKLDLNEGKVNFEFPERPPRAAKKAAKAKPEQAAE